MKRALTVIIVCLAATVSGEEAASHHFDSRGSYLPAGFPEHTQKILAVAEKPVSIHFAGLSTARQPAVRIQRVTAARRIELQPPKAEASEDGWHVIWTPPKSRGPAIYEIHLESEPVRAIQIETRNQAWLDATRIALAKAYWEAHGLTAEERAALASHGIVTQLNNATTAALEMHSQPRDTARRRIVWDMENPDMLVWRTGPSTGDLEARAPRWWISPTALSTDHGFIRFLDLFSEPPLNP